MPASANYPDFIIKNESLRLCDRSGNLGPLISNNVSNAHWSEDQSVFLVTKTDGSVVLIDKNGNIVRGIGSNSQFSYKVLEARFHQGTDIHLRLKNGENWIVDKYGNSRGKLG